MSILLFCRLNTDMFLWQPSAPKPVEQYGGKAQTALDLASTVLQESLYPAFSMCKSGVQYGMFVFSERHLEFYAVTYINPLTPNDSYSGRTAPLTSKCCILYIYSTHIGTEYFKHGIYSPFLFLQNAVCFIILTYLVPVLFTFYIQSVPKFKKIIPAPKI